MGEGPSRHQVTRLDAEPIIPGALHWAAPFVSPSPAAQSFVPEGGPQSWAQEWGNQPRAGELGPDPWACPQARRPQGCPCVVFPSPWSPLPSNELLPCHPLLGYFMFHFTGQFQQRVGLTTPFNGGKHDVTIPISQRRKPRLREMPEVHKLQIGLEPRSSDSCSLGV